MQSQNAEPTIDDTVTYSTTAANQKTEQLTMESPGMSTTPGDSGAATTIAGANSAEPVAREVSPASRPQTPYGPVRTDTTTALAQALAAPSQAPPTTVPTPQRTRRQSTAIGPSTEQPDTILKDEEQSGPRLELTLLLTNGARHPFILDPKYLAKRSVDVQGNDPFNLSVYKLKELILREWREEWEQKPSSPSYIRLISFGKLLDDKSPLKDLKFNRVERNVVHMTIKPQDFVDDDDAKGAKGGFSSGRAGNDGRSPGCRCLVM